jgi:hypothetical protein
MKRGFYDMSRGKAEQANIAAKETRQAADEPTLEPSFDPLVNMTHEAAKEDRNLEASDPCPRAWPRGSSGSEATRPDPEGPSDLHGAGVVPSSSLLRVRCPALRQQVTGDVEILD